MICDLTPNKAPCVNTICQKKWNLKVHNKMVKEKRRRSMWDWWGKVQGILGCPHQSGLHVTLFRGWWPRPTRSIPTLLTSSNPNRSFLSRNSILSTANVLQFQIKDDTIRFCLWTILIIPFYSLFCKLVNRMSVGDKPPPSLPHNLQRSFLWAPKTTYTFLCSFLTLSSKHLKGLLDPPVSV